jgi:hypothetical protein
VQICPPPPSPGRPNDPAHFLPPPPPPKKTHTTALLLLLSLGAAVVLLLLSLAAAGDNVSPTDGIFCNRALRQQANKAERHAAAASTAAASLRAARHDAKAARAADLLPSLALDLLLPATNLSRLSTARLLDAAIPPGGGGGGGNGGGNVGPAAAARLRAALQGQQALLCAAGQAKPSEDMVPVRFGNATLYVYRGNDIVSDHLAGEGHMWEEHELREFLWALRAPVPGRPDGFVAASGGGGGNGGGGGLSTTPTPPPPLAIDIGANIGWFMLNAAAAGARVAAFEAMDANVKLLRATLCANPDLALRVALYATGVGSEETECVMISGLVNRGDGHTICGEQAKDLTKMLADLKKGTGYEYASRGKMTVRRVDRMLVGKAGWGKGGSGGGGGEEEEGHAAGEKPAAEKDGVEEQSAGQAGSDDDDDSSESPSSPTHFLEAPAVVKIDIEGFEEPALRGADALFLNPRTRPWFVLTECNLGLLKDGGSDYMRFLQSRGYVLSEHGFRGPYFTDESVKGGASGYAGQNLYCVRRDWLGTEEGRKALGGARPRWVGEPTEAQAKLAG